MSVVISGVFIDKKGRYALGGAPAEPSLKIRLFVNNFVPDCDDQTSSFTECTTPGYAAIALPFVNWSYGLDASCVWTATYQQATPPTFNFSSSGGQTLYGYYVTDETDGTVCWSDTFPQGIPASPGVPISIELTYIDRQCP